MVGVPSYDLFKEKINDVGHGKVIPYSEFYAKSKEYPVGTMVFLDKLRALEGWPFASLAIRSGFEFMEYWATGEYGHNGLIYQVKFYEKEIQFNVTLFGNETIISPKIAIPSDYTVYVYN